MWGGRGSAVSHICFYFTMFFFNELSSASFLCAGTDVSVAISGNILAFKFTAGFKFASTQLTKH